MGAGDTAGVTVMAAFGKMRDTGALADSANGLES
jgi:hypothetical protein